MYDRKREQIGYQYTLDQAASSRQAKHWKATSPKSLSCWNDHHASLVEGLQYARNMQHDEQAPLPHQREHPNMSKTAHSSNYTNRNQMKPGRSRNKIHGNIPYLIVSQLAIEVVGELDCRNHVGSLDEDRSEIGTVKASIDGQIKLMIKALKVMDPAQSRCFRDVCAVIMSQSSSIKTLKIKKEESTRKQAQQNQYNCNHMQMSFARNTCLIHSAIFSPVRRFVQSKMSSRACCSCQSGANQWAVRQM